VEVGTGAQWLDLVKFTLEHQRVPCVTTDWLYLSVGGTLSVEGLGYMSFLSGLQALHVSSMTVVTGTGATVHCSRESERELFDAARAGLGQFGVITSVRLNDLRPAPESLTIWKVFYRQANAPQFFADVQLLVKENHCDNIHAVLKPCTEQCLTKVCGGPEAMTAASEAFRLSVEEGETAGEIIFFLELAVYDHRQTKEQVLGGLHFLAYDAFESTSDYLDYVTRIPPVIAINQEKGGAVPHPSVALISNPKAAMDVVDMYLQSDRGDDRLTEVLLIPLTGKTMQDVPMFPLPDGMKDLGFFCLFLGTAEPSTSEAVAALVARQRKLHDYAMDIGGSKRYSYDTVTATITGEKWRTHFGEQPWRTICAAKRRFDPDHIFTPGLHMWDL